MIFCLVFFLSEKSGRKRTLVSLSWSHVVNSILCFISTRYIQSQILMYRQISNEALELFYSTYPFHFPQSVDVALVNATLRDTLSSWARSLITRIGFMFGLLCTPGPFTVRNEEKGRQAMEAVVDLLPNVKRAVLTLTFAGHDEPEYQVKEIVTRALKIASPLRGFAGLSLEGADYENAQYYEGGA